MRKGGQKNEGETKAPPSTELNANHQRITLQVLHVKKVDNYFETTNQQKTNTLHYLERQWRVLNNIGK
ncbi:hypothetical protein HMPREF9134_00489 [Porphyromonas catoniae F0037]|uniref:Uncharacterized protein n=2 Tax=root TaxID=1 RepID=L1NGA6_9PORP|nr:hypothetical protein HMPREF9134_00489 [Porphyromonas catoniae F0037]DAE31346.1 MAG TPA: hypothetical protein [virus sp. ctDJ83]